MVASKSSYILGISAFYHDSAACLLKDGVIIAAAQEERFTRKKHDERFPVHAIQFCLNHAGIKVSDLETVAYYEKPWIKFERLLETYLSYAPRGLASYLHAIPVWVADKLWIGETIRKKLKFDGEVVFTDHHESHAASAFFPSPFKNAAILTMDGVGEWATTTWGVGKDNEIELKGEIRFPHSLGLLYSAFTYYTGFKVNSGEYKVMGLAPYGEPTYVKQILDNVIDVKEDGSFKINMEYFNYAHGLTMTSEKFHDLFGGPPRKSESLLTQRDMDFARSIQEVTEEIVLKMARNIRKVSGEKNIVLAGGVALNCVANGKILSEKIFDQMWIQPSSGDAGGALGAATFAWYQVKGNKREVSGNLGDDLQQGSYLGTQDTNEAIEAYLKEKNLPYKKLNDADLTELVAQKIVDGCVIGWHSGRMEFGPRALGARSIIGDSRRVEMQTTMNLKIKFRESFRPFAPVVLREDVSQYFEMDTESPYMLLVAPVVKSRRKAITAEEEKLFGIDKLNVPKSDIPAVTHVDYSARVQTVTAKTNPKFYNLLKRFKDKTGCSVLINTSFNVRGEPIVCSPKDSVTCFMRTNIDVLVLENCVLLKEEQPKADQNTEWMQEFELD